VIVIAIRSVYNDVQWVRQSLSQDELSWAPPWAPSLEYNIFSEGYIILWQGSSIGWAKFTSTLYNEREAEIREHSGHRMAARNQG
jgi:hypothetical protein